MNKSISIYTDGSCHTQLKIGGWAAIILINHHKTILQDVATHTTHNRMELLAVIKAIEYVQSQTTYYQPIDIYSDSQYVVNLVERKDKLLRNRFTSSKGTLIQNADLVQPLITEMDRQDLRFIKVKAHQKKAENTNYNREVDILVRKMMRTYLQENLLL